MKKIITFFLASICICHAANAQATIKIGIEQIKVGQKVASFKMLDANKKPVYIKEYYILKVNDNELVITDVKFDMKKVAENVFNYTIVLSDIEPSDDLAYRKENTMGSYVTTDYYSVAVAAKEGKVFKYKSYEYTPDSQSPPDEEDQQFTFAFSTTSEANKWIAILKEAFKK